MKLLHYFNFMPGPASRQEPRVAESMLDLPLAAWLIGTPSEAKTQLAPGRRLQITKSVNG